MLWYGTVASIPSGWHLCDGTAGTIDLRNKFIVCAGDSYNPADGGGAINHTHDFTGDGHFHTLVPGKSFTMGVDTSNTTTVDPAAGTTDAEDGRPPYYALAYIQKL